MPTTADEKRAQVRALMWRRRHESITGKQRQEAMRVLEECELCPEAAQWCFQNYVHLELCGPRSNIQSQLAHADGYRLIVDEGRITLSDKEIRHAE